MNITCVVMMKNVMTNIDRNKMFERRTLFYTLSNNRDFSRKFTKFHSLPIRKPIRYLSPPFNSLGRMRATMH